MKVLELWRYPVKSMQSERLDQAVVGSLGIEGDRRRAVVDAETGVSLSAKRYAELLLCHASTTDEEVMIGFPDASEYPADSSDAANGLSDLLRRRVVVRTAQAGETVRHEFPTDMPTGGGDSFIWEPGLDAFFDRAPLHLLTTATLDAFSRIRPDSVFEHARFRPNILVETAERGFVENDWVGRDVSLGAVTCHVLDHKPRCVMTTRPQGKLAHDRDVIRTIAKNNEGNAGVELRALEGGILHSGDAVRLLN